MLMCVMFAAGGVQRAKPFTCAAPPVPTLDTIRFAIIALHNAHSHAQEPPAAPPARLFDSSSQDRAGLLRRACLYLA